MKSNFYKGIAVFTTIILITPSIFLVVPQKARAYVISVQEVGTNLASNIKTAIESTISAIKNTITAVYAPITAAATVAQQINSYVLQPLAFLMSGNLLKSITASIVGFVGGKSNGTGKAQFVLNLRGEMQNIGDIQALAFISALQRRSNSPFASSIASSLRTNYMQNTSVSGFFAANQCTLSKSSPNINSFLAGDWSQGGMKSWFALTTQNQNNPYTFYQASQNELTSLVGEAQSARLAELNWGQGYKSWCGGSSTSGSGDPCTNKDGSPGTIQTPGSTIKAALDKALGTDQDKLVRMGNTASEINSILGSVGSIMNTMGLASNIVGGSSGGLLGSTRSSSSGGTSRLMQYQNAPGYLGVTPSTVYQNATALPASGTDMLNRISQYKASWDTIGAAANTASTSVLTLSNHCLSQASVARGLVNGRYAGNEFATGLLSSFITTSTSQASTSQAAFSTEILPVFTRMAAASSTMATANAMVEKLKAELNSTSESAGADYSADMYALQTMSPTATDIGNALQDAQTFGTATASPTNPLLVSGDSIVDKMNLLSSNANSLKSSCDVPPDDVLNPPQQNYYGY